MGGQGRLGAGLHAVMQPAGENWVCTGTGTIGEDHAPSRVTVEPLFCQTTTAPQELGEGGKLILRRDAGHLFHPIQLIPEPMKSD